VSELGDILRDARLKRGWTLADIAEATRIKVSYLEALENGDYAGLPGPAYITGFLRNYATQVGLHPDDMVQEYYASRPPQQPAVKAATRVLASGYDRQNRTRLLWALGMIVVLLIGGYAVKQYADNQYAHAYSPPLNVTPANLGTAKSQHHRPAVAVHDTTFRVRLQAISPAWVRVKVDGKRVFQGILHPRSGRHVWFARQTIYVVTLDGPRIKAFYNGRPVGPIARHPGLTVQLATVHAWHNVA
jgi:cytoskeleton protein RodZ